MKTLTLPTLTRQLKCPSTESFTVAESIHRASVQQGLQSFRRSDYCDRVLTNYFLERRTFG
jgi:hypothetical protein